MLTSNAINFGSITHSLSANLVAVTVTPDNSTLTSTEVSANATYYGSYSVPNFLLSWIDQPTHTDFIFTCMSISSNRAKRDISSSSIDGINNVYIAMGLSLKNRMVCLLC